MTNPLRRFTTAETALPLLVLLSIASMILPMPSYIIDTMVAFNLFIAIFILLATINVVNILNLTTFPSMLLLTTIFRLAVSISTTRAILSKGDAGGIVKSFGEFVVGDNLVVGLVVFLVVAIVQFMVITKGGERIAEVTARFTLDALPGKQMSIDADLRNGDLTKEAAKQRRQRLEQESQFFGSMDGAMRFVKGDCIASMLIVCVNLIGGLLIGTMMLELSTEKATHLFLVLSIGDGLVAQIPSILSTLAAGILTTRITQEEEKGGLGFDIVGQFSGERKSMWAAAGAIGGLGLIPGFPALVLLPLAGLIGGALLYTGALRSKAKKEAMAETPGSALAGAVQKNASLPAAKFSDPLVIECQRATFDRLNALQIGESLADAVQNIANRLGCGVHLPKWSVLETAPPAALSIVVDGVHAKVLHMADGQTREQIVRAIAEEMGRQSPKTFGIDDASLWLDAQTRQSPRLVELVQQQIPLQTLSEVLCRLLKEGVSITHARTMLSELLNSISHRFGSEELLGDARVALAPQILSGLVDEKGSIAVLELHRDSLQALEAALRDPENLTDFDGQENNLADAAAQIDKALRSYQLAYPRIAISAPASIRARLWNLLFEHGIHVPVLSHPELEHAKDIRKLGPLKIDLPFAASAPNNDWKNSFEEAF
ncbi:MAG: Flagellar biosynthesis protein FlhA [Hyphomicrobiales bacterium]|nr:Flagellar biosynthesis protein FlhA [Hyphomicrobiales bacterium]